MPGAAFEAAGSCARRERGPRVVMIARMNAHYKNHAGFLRIAADVHRRMPEVEFLLVGDARCAPRSSSRLRRSRFRAAPPISGDRRDIPAILASSDVAVLTSDSEGLSNVILEAMAAGVPVIAYAVGGNLKS